MVLLLFFGLSMGLFVGKLMTPIFSLWLRTVSVFDVKTTSRLTDAFSCVDSAIVGASFQAHTLLIGAVDNTGGNTTSFVTTLSLYGPIAFLFVMGLVVTVYLLPDDVDDDETDDGKGKADDQEQGEENDLDDSSASYCPQKVARHPSVAVSSRSSFVIHDHLHRGSSLLASINSACSGSQ